MTSLINYYQKNNAYNKVSKWIVNTFSTFFNKFMYNHLLTFKTQITIIKISQLFVKIIMYLIMMHYIVIKLIKSESLMDVFLFYFQYFMWKMCNVLNKLNIIRLSKKNFAFRNFI